MNEITISVVVPIYNVEQYIRECLDSLAAQTLNSIEVLLINDGTKDCSGEIAKEYAEKWPERFRYFEKKNGGLSDARNFAFPHVRGRYIAFVDSDDYVDAHMYELLWNKALDTGADIVECELYKVYTSKLERINLPTCYSDIKNYMINTRVCAWNKLYKTQWIKDLSVEFPKGLLYEDICFFFKIAPFMRGMPTTVHEPLYFYRQREGSILSASNKRILEVHDIFEMLFDYYSKHNLLNEYEDVTEYKYVKTVLCSFLLRMLKIKDKKMRDEVITASWKRLNQNRPNWRKNSYLKQNSVKDIYMRMITPLMIDLMKLLIH